MFQANFGIPWNPFGRDELEIFLDNKDRPYFENMISGGELLKLDPGENRLQHLLYPKRALPLESLVNRKVSRVKNLGGWAAARLCIEILEWKCRFPNCDLCTTSSSFDIVYLNVARLVEDNDPGKPICGLINLIAHELSSCTNSLLLDTNNTMLILDNVPDFSASCSSQALTDYWDPRQSRHPTLNEWLQPPLAHFAKIFLCGDWSDGGDTGSFPRQTVFHWEAATIIESKDLKDAVLDVDLASHVGLVLHDDERKWVEIDDGLSVEHFYDLLDTVATLWTWKCQHPFSYPVRHISTGGKQTRAGLGAVFNCVPPGIATYLKLYFAWRLCDSNFEVMKRSPILTNSPFFSELDNWNQLQLFLHIFILKCTHFVPASTTPMLTTAQLLSLNASLFAVKRSSQNCPHDNGYISNKCRDPFGEMPASAEKVTHFIFEEFLFVHYSSYYQSSLLSTHYCPFLIALYSLLPSTSKTSLVLRSMRSNVNTGIVSSQHSWEFITNRIRQFL